MQLIDIEALKCEILGAVATAAAQGTAPYDR